MATSTEWIVNELPGLTEKTREDIIELIERQNFSRSASGCRDVETGDDPESHTLAVIYPGANGLDEEEGEVELVDAPKAQPYQARHICVFVLKTGGINVYCPAIGSMATISGPIAEAEAYVKSQFPEEARFGILYHSREGLSAGFRGSDSVKKVRYVSVDMFLRSITKLIGPDERIIKCKESFETLVSDEGGEYPAVLLYNELYRMGLDSDQLRMMVTIL